MPVRFQDVDAAGIVFFARIYDYAHDAFVLFLREIGLPLEGLLPAARSDAGPGQTIDVGMPIVHAEADYRAALRFGEVVDIRVAPPEIGETSIKMAYELSVDGQLRARVRITHVSVQFDVMRPLRVPDAWRAKLNPA